MIVSHDLTLSRLTDVEDHKEFAKRKILRNVLWEQINDWWIMDFTLVELKTLKIKSSNKGSV